jgi:hypothetical protein
MEQRKPELWDSPEVENLRGYATKDEAIEGILDDLVEKPETIEVCGYAHMVPDFEHYGPLDDVLEALDGEYAGEAFTEPTQAMKDAEKAFMDVIAKEYFVYNCDEVCRETVNVAEWIKVHRPDWLTPSGAVHD